MHMVNSPTPPFPSHEDSSRSSAKGVGDPLHSGASPVADGPRGSAGSADSSEARANRGIDADGANSGLEVLDRVVRGAHATVDRLAESAAPHVQRLSDGIGKAGDAVHSRTSDMRELGDEWTDSLRTTVREHPVAAVVTALAVGVLLARLTS